MQPLNMTFEVLTTATMKITAFCDVTPCSRVINVSEERPASTYSEDGESKFTLNVGKHLPDHMMSHSSP
jgi:hypothetical protein